LKFKINIYFKINGHTTPTFIDHTHALNGFENASKIRDTEKLKGSFTLWQK